MTFNQQQSQHSKLPEKVVEALKRRPEYVLVFAIFFFGIGAVTYGISQNSVGAQATGLAALLLGLGIAAWVVVRLEGKGGTTQLTGSEDIDEHLRSVLSALQEAIQIPHPEFRKIVVDSCAELADRLSQIKNGQITATWRQYNDLTLRLEGIAKHSVIAVHRGRYLDNWIKRVGRYINEPHAATVTRMFVFDRRTDITDEHIKMFYKLSELGQDVRLYFDAEDDHYDFPPDFPRDYRLIDGGEIISVTDGDDEEFGFSGRWYFNDRNMKQNYQNEAAALRKWTEALDKIYPEKPAIALVKVDESRGKADAA